MKFILAAFLSALTLTASAALVWMVTALRYGVDDHGTRNTMPPLTRDFAGNDAPGKVIIASRWRAFSTGLFFTAYMGIFADSGIIKNYTKGIKSMIFSFFFSKNAFGGK